MKRLAALFLMVLLPVLSSPAQEDQYMNIYDLIQEGDGFVAANQPVQALAKYMDAQNRLQRFQQIHPAWNPNIVKYRLTYLSEKTASLSEHLPAVSESEQARQTNNTPASAASPSEMASRVQLLQAQVRQLQADNTSLEAKLQEALSAKPASIDPRELTKAQEQIKTLQKENDLLKVNLDEKSKSITSVTGGPSMSELKEQLDEANKRLTAHAGQVETLTAERSKLQERLDSMTRSQTSAAEIEKLKSALSEATRKLGEQTQMTAKLALEKQALQERPNVAPQQEEGDPGVAYAAVRAENELLRKQLADLRARPPGAESDAARELAEARAQISALLSEKEALRLERVVLEDRMKQLTAAPVGTAARASSGPVASGSEAERIKVLERERNEMRAQLVIAREELNARYAGQALVGRVQELTGQIEVLRTRLGVLDAQKVPYTSEELALFEKPAVRPVDRGAATEPARRLPDGTAILVAEAQQDFAARRFEDAERKYREVLSRDEKNVYTLANLAAIQMEMDRMEDAEKNIKQALAMASEDPYSVAILGFLQFRQGKYDESLDTLAKAAKLDPRNAEVQNYIGLALSQKGMPVPAETALRKALEIDPKYASAHYNLAVVYATQEPPSAALARLHYGRARALGMPRNEEFEKILDKAETARAAQ